MPLLEEPAQGGLALQGTEERKNYHLSASTTHNIPLLSTPEERITAIRPHTGRVRVGVSPQHAFFNMCENKKRQ